MEVFFAWITSLRIKTLPLAISPIILGNALSYWQNAFNAKIFVLTIITACLLQILSNLANDYGDNINGADKMDRIGPKRGLQNGLITLRQLYVALIINAILCVVCGVWLVSISCQTQQEFIGFISVGGLAIFSAITYTIGRNAYGYFGLGDLSVFIFFGLVSVFGSFYLQARMLPIILIIPACSSGLLATAVLNINNLRDYYSDRLANKKTVVVFIGIHNAKYYQIALIILSYLLFSVFSLTILKSKTSFLFLLSLPIAIKQILFILHQEDNQQIGKLLIPTVKLALLTTCLYSLGIILS
ncbi:1,4-dihydroxy-2-naphthoate polyprenyltransferase [Orbaceae bacterium ac157xtp]